MLAMIPVDEDDDEQLEKMWQQLSPEEQESYRIIAESLAPHELMEFMTRGSNRNPGMSLPTPTIDDFSSSVEFDKVDEITAQRMKKFLGKN